MTEPNELLTQQAWARRVVGDIRSATESLKISVFLFSPRWNHADYNLVNECLAARDKGIQCRLVMSTAPLKLRKTQPNVETALILQKGGWQVRMIGGPQTLHEKMIIVDNETLYIGSHNLAISSAISNFDLSIRTQEQPMIGQANKYFWERWAKGKPPEKAKPGHPKVYDIGFIP